MRKGEMKNRWDEEDIRQFLRKSAEEEIIPESLQPARMEEWLRQQCNGVKEGSMGRQTTEKKGREPERKKNMDSGQEIENNRQKTRKHIGFWCGTIAAAACLALALLTAGGIWIGGSVLRMGSDSDMSDEAATDGMPDDETYDAAADEMEESEFQEGTTYAKLYQSFDKYWTEQEEMYRDDATYDAAAETTDAAADDAASDMEYAENKGISDGLSVAEDMADGESSGQEDGSEADYGKTNQQEDTVEEADIIKNDGRFLYRVIDKKGGYKRTVRIVDTEGGLKEVAQVGSFESIQNIYVWGDKLVVIEPGWADTFGVEEDASIWTPVNSYCRIYVYDISDRANPQEYHTFTVKGSYMDSRISGGYLYFFTSCDTSRPEKEEDLRAYVPILDGEPIAEDKITLPEGSEATSYLVMASVDMSHPDKFVDTRALVTSADRFYVSPSNIYMADTQYVSYGEEGIQSDSTILYRYSYQSGKMRKEAKGTVKGTLRDDMAMNEYQSYLRLVTTVESQDVTKIIDDITGEFIGYDGMGFHMTNSLYVLDSDLETVGKIENLAKDERVYSARFMGNAGYFVTFRETDPLFSVDLSNPREPKILGELKISGFSEYLHFYADDLLLGIGMEADEDTGMTECMKLSMFDISDPSDVKEQSKMELSEYEYSEALYSYKEVLIDTKKNLFGFLAEDYEDDKNAYLLFTFENGEFHKVMEIDCDYERYGYGIRGTYIGDRFFLLAENGLVEEYSLKDGSRTRVLEL